MLWIFVFSLVFTTWLVKFHQPGLSALVYLCVHIARIFKEAPKDGGGEFLYICSGP